MSAKPKSGGIHVKGDVSGIIVYGDDNQVTAREADTPAPAADGLSPRQRNSAEDNGTVYAVARGTMNVTINSSGRPGDEERENGEQE